MPDEWRAFRKPAVVDQRVGFLLDGGSSARTRGSPPDGPLAVSRAGSLLRRTWSGISEGQTATERHFSLEKPPTLKQKQQLSRFQLLISTVEDLLPG